MRPLLDRTVSKGETAVLQCIAGGSPPPRLNWTKDDSPLVVTERHFFAAGNQLLIIVDSDISDAGKYTCEMSNTLGTERGHVRLSVIPTPTCDSPQLTASALDDDGWATVGIVIIAVVCCVVGTSLVWVVIIYHTRRRNEDCSITNTGVSAEAWHGRRRRVRAGVICARRSRVCSQESCVHAGVVCARSRVRECVCSQESCARRSRVCSQESCVRRSHVCTRES